MPQKIFSSFLIFGFVCLGFSSEVFAQVSATNQSIYDTYLGDNSTLSSWLSTCGAPNPWSAGDTDTFLKIKDLKFAPMGDEAALQSVWKMIGDFGGNVPNMGGDLGEDTPTVSSPKMLDYFEANTELYNAVLNNLFACALVNSKAQIYNDIEAAKSNGGFRFLQESSLKDYLPPLKQKNNEDATLYKCRALGTQSNNEPLKRKVMSERLINTSSYLTCRYLAYTRYVKNVAEQEWAILDGARNTNDLVSTRQILESRIAAAPSLATQTISSTFDSYLSFESAYELHIYLLLIRDSYIVMRQRLDDALAPFSQFIYKAHNVTAPGR